MKKKRVVKTKIDPQPNYGSVKAPNTRKEKVCVVRVHSHKQVS